MPVPLSSSVMKGSKFRGVRVIAYKGEHKGAMGTLSFGAKQNLTIATCNLAGIIPDNVVLNDLLQFKLMQAVHDTSRFAINSTVGLIGIVDVASNYGFKKHNEDFGQTLGFWGVSTGPYIVLPLFGPSDLRDTIGLIGDNIYTNPIDYIDDVATRKEFILTNTIDSRAGLLSAEKIVNEAAFDEYTFVKEAYLQRRQNLVYDGDPPEKFDVFEE